MERQEKESEEATQLHGASQPIIREVLAVGTPSKVMGGDMEI